MTARPGKHGPGRGGQVATHDGEILGDVRPNAPRPSRRDEPLSLAADLFAARGFAGVTVDDIGEAAGVSGPALYHHFDSRESLLGEMLVRNSESLLTKATATANTSRPRHSSR